MDYASRVLTLQKIMGSDSEMKYIAKERNLIPAFIEQICTEIIRDNSVMDIHKTYGINILVRKKSVDYLESLGYNLFRQFESEKTCEFFDGPIEEISEENVNGTKKFSVVATLEYELHIYAYVMPSRIRERAPVLMEASEYFVAPSDDTFLLPSSRNRLDDPTTGCISPVDSLHSRRPIWSSTKRLPTSLRSSLETSSSEEEDSLHSEEAVNLGIFQKVACLKSSLWDVNDGMFVLENLNINESEVSNPGTSAVESIQKNDNILPLDYSVRSGTAKRVNVNTAAKMENNFFGTFGNQRKFSPTLEICHSSSDGNNVEQEFPVSKAGHLKHKYPATISFPLNLSDYNFSSLDSLQFGQVATAAKLENRNPGNSSFQSTSTYYSASNSDSYVLNTKCRNEEESLPPLTWNNNYSEASKAYEVQEEDFHLSKNINDLGNNHFYRNRENSARRAVSLDTSPEDSSLSVQEQEDSGLFIGENSFFPKHISLKRSASSPASSPRSSFRSLRNPKRERLSQPDLTDSHVSDVSNYPSTSTTNKRNYFLDTNVFYSETQELSRENFANTSHCELENFNGESTYGGHTPAVAEVGNLYNISEYYHVIKQPPKNDCQNELKKGKRRSDDKPDYFKRKNLIKEEIQSAHSSTYQGSINHHKHLETTPIFKEFPSRFKRQEPFKYSSPQRDVTLSMHPQETVQRLLNQEEHPKSAQSDECSECAQRLSDDFNSFKLQGSLECEHYRKRSGGKESKHSEISAILDRLQDSDGLIQSIEITEDDEDKGKSELPPVDLSLVWDRKYRNSRIHFAFKNTHPHHYKREYNRIRQSRLSVFDSLMSRQASGPLSQRKVLEAVARPYYNIYPPADVEEINRFQHSRNDTMLRNLEGHLHVKLESLRGLSTYPLY